MRHVRRFPQGRVPCVWLHCECCCINFHCKLYIISFQVSRGEFPAHLLAAAGLLQEHLHRIHDCSVLIIAVCCMYGTFRHITTVHEQQLYNEAEPHTSVPCMHAASQRQHHAAPKTS